MQMRRLLVISHTPHHRRDDGELVGWGPTIRELDQLATRFSRVRHVAVLHEDESAPASAIPYSAPNIELVAVRPSGGNGMRGKLDALRASPTYLRAIIRELDDADVVHVRAPANIALLAMILLGARKRPSARWIKYAGNWKPTGKEAMSYTLQRWWLSHRMHQAIVTVNGEWRQQPAWVRTFFNPSLSDADLQEGRLIAEQKQLTSPVRLLYVGRIEDEKGAGRALQVTAELRAVGIDAELELIGDGPRVGEFRRSADLLGLGERARFLGPQAPSVLRQHYATAHISLLPTAASEGWPKVLSEGMAYGVVPVAGAVSSIPQYIDRFGSGAALPPTDISAFVSRIVTYVRQPELWAEQSRRGLSAASYFSYRHYLASVDELLGDLVGRAT